MGRLQRPVVRMFPLYFIVVILSICEYSVACSCAGRRRRDLGLVSGRCAPCESTQVSMIPLSFALANNIYSPGINFLCSWQAFKRGPVAVSGNFLIVGTFEDSAIGPVAFDNDGKPLCKGLATLILESQNTRLR
jgi:hypothetical protein